MRPIPEVFEAAIVAVGSFNPPLVNPTWLQSQGVMGAGDVETAISNDMFLISRQVARFQSDSALVQVLENQLSVGSVGPVTPALADLAISIFELLPHTPVSALGLNFMGHFKVDSQDSYRRIGDFLAPKALWRDLFPDKYPGLTDYTISIQDGEYDPVAAANNPAAAVKNEKRFTIQPSQRIQYGIFIRLNDHYARDMQDAKLSNAAAAASVVRKEWQSCYSDALTLFEKILVKADVESQ